MEKENQNNILNSNLLPYIFSLILSFVSAWIIVKIDSAVIQEKILQLEHKFTEFNEIKQESNKILKELSQKITRLEVIIEQKNIRTKNE